MSVSDYLSQTLPRLHVVATYAEQTPLMPIRGTYAALAISESYRDQGRDVLLILDSLTQLILAQQEIGLSSVETTITPSSTPCALALPDQLFARVGEVAGGIEALRDELCQPIVQGMDLETSVQQLNALFTGNRRYSVCSHS